MLHSLRFRLLLTMSVVVLAAVGTMALFTSRSTTNAFERYLQGDVIREQRLVSELLATYKGDSSTLEMEALVNRLAQISGERIIIAERGGLVVVDSEGKLVGQSIELPPPPAMFMGPGRVAIAPEASVPSTGTLAFDVSGPLPITGTSWAGASAITQPMGITFSQEAAGVAGAQNQFVWAPLFVPLAMAPIHVTTQGGPAAPTDLIVARVPNLDSPTEGGFVSSMNQQLLLAVAVAGVVALLLTWLLSRRILGPVEALTAAAGKMEKGDLRQRVDVRSKDEIGELAHAFNAMADGLTRMEQLRRNMVTDVAHELRTPLSNIRGYLEAIRDGVAEPDAALISSLHEEALLLSHLVDDLQELELAEAGQLKLVPRPTNLTDTIEKALTALQHAAYEKSITLEADLPEDLPTIEADPARIGQVLRNLLDNAITHTPEGGRIQVRARTLDDEVEVRVSDTGPGIRSEHLPFIFERFYRADPSRTRSTGGAGLGLSIVKHLVGLHGGNVRAESSPGHGASFYFTLPLSLTSTQPPARAASLAGAARK